jgi:hypothetical protein
VARTPQQKLVTLFETAKKALLIIDHLYDNLENSSSLVASTNEFPSTSPIIIDLYICALGLVDYLNRFYEVVQAMPLLKKRSK